MYVLSVLTALIPARGGSKRVPQKNIKMLGSKPLIDWTIEISLECNFFENVIVSTDSLDVIMGSKYLYEYVSEFESILSGQTVSLNNGLLIHKRGEELARDNSKTIQLVQELIKNQNLISKKLMLLQPTSPFRTTSEIREVIQIHEKTTSSSVFSVKRAQSPHPYKSFQVDKLGRIQLDETHLGRLTTPEQELPSMFAPDGAYYLASRDFLMDSESFVSKDSTCFVREGFKTLNIDSEMDFLVAQLIIQNKLASL